METSAAIDEPGGLVRARDAVERNRSTRGRRDAAAKIVNRLRGADAQCDEGGQTGPHRLFRLYRRGANGAVSVVCRAGKPPTDRVETSARAGYSPEVPALGGSLPLAEGRPQNTMVCPTDAPALHSKYAHPSFQRQRRRRENQPCRCHRLATLPA